ncbi:MAG: histidine phosphatase family protein [Clostridiales bacterium]|nr:histidine phosphatase family protein [Clostridiales bacterium]
MRIILVRHGDPDYLTDSLTELGKKQADALARRLMGEGIKEIYSSSMGRARETAEAFARLSGIGPIRTLDFMREIRFGYGEALYESGNPWDEADNMAQEGHEINDPSWHEWPFFQGNAATEDVDLVEKETDVWLSGLGYDREGPYYRCKRTDDQEYTVVLFAHGGSETAMMARILNLPFPYLCGIIRMRCTSITIIRFDSTPGSKIMPVLELTGDAGHLSDIL